MNKTQQFLDILFDDEDKIFVGSDLYSGSVMDKKDISAGQFFCLNACEGGRKKSDIVKFRNFLIEIDEIPGTKDPMPHLDQIDLLYKQYQIPFSTVVNTGNKSIHFIISLKDPLDNLAEYESIATWLKNIIVEADKSVLTPEKLSRLSGGINLKTMKDQKGYVSKLGRVSNDRFLEWLSRFPNAQSNNQVARDVGAKPVSKNREGVMPIVFWYLTEFLGKPYNDVRGHYQCPVCASEGCDTSQDNMYVSGPDMKFHCFAVKEHNKLIFREMRSLYYQHKK